MSALELQRQIEALKRRLQLAETRELHGDRTFINLNVYTAYLSGATQTTRGAFSVLEYDANNVDNASFSISIPIWMGGRTARVVTGWATGTAGTGNVYSDIAYRWMQNAGVDSADKFLNTSGTSAIFTPPQSAADRFFELNSSTLTFPSEIRGIHLRIFRSGNQATDTFNQSLFLFAARLELMN